MKPQGELDHLFEALWEPVKHVLDGLSIAATLAALLQYLPAATAVLTFIWTAIRLWETATVQRWLGRGKGGGR